MNFEKMIKPEKICTDNFKAKFKLHVKVFMNHANQRVRMGCFIYRGQK